MAQASQEELSFAHPTIRMSCRPEPVEEGSSQSIPVRVRRIMRIDIQR